MTNGKGCTIYMGKQRVDVLLVERGLCETREKAKRLIMAGVVFSNSERIDKPGMKLDENVQLHVKGKDMPYVGRGGLKLEHALRVFDVGVKGQKLVDIGSSTGGFTDCALQNGAQLSYAVDVGYNQLAWKLRQDNRVIVMERTNFRYVTKDDFTHGLPNVASIDVSFISLTLIFPVLKNILADQSEIITLIKPQFEAGRDQVGKGIVRDPRIHQEVLHKICDFVKELGFSVHGLHFSPITGSKGNIEYLMHASWGETEHADLDCDEAIDDIVKQSHEELK